jgi:hypothetical protein
VTGTIVAIRYYKGSQNSGTHVGHLWTSGGDLLATTTFIGENAAGWQQATLDPPVMIDANTTYVASYHSPDGYYAADDGYFLQAGADNPPLHALQDGVDGENAIFVHGPSGTFPNDSYNGTNYWVDVVLCH